MKTLLTIAALLIASPVIAQEMEAAPLPSVYSPGFEVDNDAGHAAGMYALPIWLLSEPAFSNGYEVCDGVGSSVNSSRSMSCIGSVTFVDRVIENVDCSFEVPTDDTFVALCW